MKHYDTIIIGTGAAGLSAGVYAGRYAMKSLVIGKEFGGETAKAGKIENYPGFTEIDGYELMERMKSHAEAVGAEITDGEVKKITPDGKCFIVSAGDDEYHTHSVIVAIGSERRRLGLPNEKELTGKGVHYCVTCDGPIYSGKTIALVGGGDASAKGAALAAEYVDKIYLLVRGKQMRAEPINQEKLKKLSDKIEILYETEVKEIIPDEKGMFSHVVLNKEVDGSRELRVDGLFIEIGAQPNTSLTDPLGVETDGQGYIKTDNMMRTNVPGVFAAGDIANLFGHFKQDITSAAMGAVAATSAYDYYKENKEACSHER